MEPTTLAGTDIRTSRIGFGCASLMRLPTRRERQALLGAAYDIGIRHFDVARMYGLGAVERELGIFLRGRRDQVTVTTKFGIAAHGLVEKLHWMQPLMRGVANAFPGLKRRATQRADQLYAARHYTAQGAEASLMKSLRELGTDYVDMFFLHEPCLHDTIDARMEDCLEGIRRRGRIRAYGIAGSFERSGGIFSRHHRLCRVVQTDNDVLHREAIRQMDFSARALITFSPLSQALGTIAPWIESRAEMRARWNDVLNEDFSATDTLARFLIAYALYSNPRGVVLFSTTQPARLQRLARWLDNGLPPQDRVNRFVELVDAELPSNSRAGGDMGADNN